jgi:hypothetical protein
VLSLAEEMEFADLYLGIEKLRLDQQESRQHRRSDFRPADRVVPETFRQEAILRRKTRASRHIGMEYGVIDVECLLMG